MIYGKIKQFMCLFSLVVLFGMTVYGQCSEADKRALEALDKKWGDISDKGDRAALDKIYADEFVNIGFLNTTGKKQAIDNAVSQAAQANAESANQPKPVYDTYVISCTPNTATITHRVAVRSKTGEGQYKNSYSRAIHFLEKRGGEWKVVSSTGHPFEGAGHLVGKEIDGYKAYLRRDADWFDRNTADNYMGVGINGQSYNKTQMLEMMKNDKNKYETVKLSDVNVQMNGDMGIISGVYHIKGMDADGKPMEMRMRFTRTLAKDEDDGRWKAVAGHASVVNDVNN